MHNNNDKVTMSADAFVNKFFIEWADGSKEWWADGKRHRLGGPAIEWSDGGKEWWVRGISHRLDGPAIERPDGRKEWWVNGKLHRIGGPAVSALDGYKVWAYKGVSCKTKQTYFNRLNKKEKELCLLSPEFFDA